MTIEEVIQKTLSEKKEYYRNDEFVNLISRKTKESKNEIKRVIRNMVSRGDIKVDLQNKMTARTKFVTEPKEGIIIGNRNGYAFCKIIGENVPDYFIARENLNGAVNRDRVVIRPIGDSSKTKRSEAEVEQIVERGNKQIVGTFYLGDGYAVVEPDDDRFSAKIILESGVSKISANPGDKIVVKLLNQPLFSGAYFTGEVIENLGPADSIDAYVLSIVRGHNLIEEFPAEVLEYCKKLKAPTEEQLKGRKDFRKLQTFTIDGKDARDLDDAISMTRLDNGNVQLGVHIADVGEYVRRGNPIDEEAFARGTSVYFPAPDNLEHSKIRAVIPMIPEALSNDLCSLNPHTDKLTLSCMMEIDPKGEIVEGDNTYVCESVINTCHRLNYDEVYNVLQGVEEDTKRLSDIKDTLLLMGKYSKILSAKSKEEGCLDLDLPEPKFVFDENNHVCAVEERRQNEAHKLIENFMIAANRTVAKKFKLLNIPFVYRVHEHPDEKKVQDALKVIKNCCSKNFDVPNCIDGKFLEQVLNSSDDPVVNQAINSMILRAMPKAIYSPQCMGHFGLALKYYSHFTSPIRRYPDLTIHRIIKDYLHHKIGEQDIDRLKSFVYDSAMQSSLTEQNAAKVEREVDDLWCCEFMRDKIDKEFEVVVSDVKEYGVYVRIPNTAVEGLIRIEYMTDKRFIYNDERRLLVGGSTKFGIGDRLKVKVHSVDMFKREIDFSYVQHLNKDNYANFRQNNKKLKGIEVCPKEKVDEKIPQFDAHFKPKNMNQKASSKKNKQMHKLNDLIH
ncbi:MAG: ribonuclease R [Christensenellales bacterium]